MSDIDRQIQSRVEGFVAELSSLVRKAAVAAVESALMGRAPHAAAPSVAKAAPGRKPGPGRRPAGKASAPKTAVRAAHGSRKPGEKRTKEELDKLTERLADYIRSNKGQGVEAIARAIGAETRELSLPIKKLLSGKRITSQGHKRATRYFPK